MDKSMKETFKYAIILFIITAISAALLAGVNVMTAGQIAKNAFESEQKALGKVMSEAVIFEALEDETSTMYGVDAIYVAKNEAQEIIGYCVKISQNGYGGAVQSLVGVKKEKIITGIEVLSHSETPGLGANLMKDSFREQFKGKGKVEVVKAGAKDMQINALTGATITSEAVANSVNAAIDIVNNITTEFTYVDDEEQEEVAADE